MHQLPASIFCRDFKVGGGSLTPASLLRVLRERSKVVPAISQPPQSSRARGGGGGGVKGHLGLPEMAAREGAKVERPREGTR